MRWPGSSYRLPERDGDGPGLALPLLSASAAGLQSVPVPFIGARVYGPIALDASDDQTSDISAVVLAERRLTAGAIGHIENPPRLGVLGSRQRGRPNPKLGRTGRA